MTDSVAAKAENGKLMLFKWGRYWPVSDLEAHWQMIKLWVSHPDLANQIKAAREAARSENGKAA